MSQGGSLVQFAVSPETTNGTYAAPIGSEFVPNAGGDWDETKETVELTAGFGNVSSVKTRKKSKALSNGKVIWPLGIRNAGTALIWVFGQNPDTEGDDPYTHDFAFANTNHHKTVTVQKIDPEIGLRAFAGCVLNQWVLEATANGEFIMFDATGMGGPAEASPSTVEPAYDDSEVYFTPDMLTVREAATVEDLASAQDVVAEKINLQGSKNGVIKGRLGTVSATRGRNGRISVTGSIDIELSGSTERNFALTSGTKALRLTFTSGSHSLVITLAEVSYDAPPAPSDLEGIAVLTRNFVVHDPVQNMTAVLTNNVAAYPRS